MSCIEHMRDARIMEHSRPSIFGEHQAHARIIREYAGIGKSHPVSSIADEHLATISIPSGSRGPRVINRYRGWCGLPTVNQRNAWYRGQTTVEQLLDLIRRIAWRGLHRPIWQTTGKAEEKGKNATKTPNI